MVQTIFIANPVMMSSILFNIFIDETSSDHYNKQRKTPQDKKPPIFLM